MGVSCLFDTWSPWILIVLTPGLPGCKSATRVRQSPVPLFSPQSPSFPRQGLASFLSPSFSFFSFLFPTFFPSGRPDITHHTHTLVLDTYPSFVAMGENWFQREFLTPRRLVFNVLFYGSQIFWFALGWYLQVCLNIISLWRILLTTSFFSENKQ